MKCPNCETENNPKDKTCLNCGKPLPVTGANAERTVRLRKCRRCGFEYKAGFCPSCGLWNGPPPGGIIFIAISSIVNAAILLLIVCFFLVFSDRYEIDAFRLVLLAAFSILAGGNLTIAINLLRLKRWAVVVYRIILIIGIVGMSAMFLVGLAQGFSLFNLIDVCVSIGWCIFLLSYLKGKAHLFSNRISPAVPEVKRRVCSNCGNEELTSFDRVCPKCKKALA